MGNIIGYFNDFQKAYQGLKSKKASKTIQVYVEDNEDIAFWHQILSAYETENIYFEIDTPSNTTLERGKSAVLKKLISEDNTGEYLLACIDSDYDYLLQNQTEKSKKINTHPYIFQTFTYSIENYRCYSPSLKNLCVRLTKNDNKIFDFNEFLRVYSNIIYDLFLWSFYMKKIGDEKIFILKKFCSVINLGKIKINNLKTILEKLDERVKNKISELKTIFPNKENELKEIAKELEVLGANKDNIYLFVQGHSIFDNVIERLLKPIVRKLFSEKEQEIKNNAKEDNELNKRLNQYHKETINFGKETVEIEHQVKKALNENTNFTSCPLYKKLTNQIENYIEIIKA